jgi:hypothetical protein
MPARDLMTGTICTSIQMHMNPIEFDSHGVQIVVMPIYAVLSKGGFNNRKMQGVKNPVSLNIIALLLEEICEDTGTYGRIRSFDKSCTAMERLFLDRTDIGGSSNLCSEVRDNGTGPSQYVIDMI